MNNGSTDAPITYRGLVYPWHCDHMGHMNVMWYTGKFDEASWSLLSRLGLTQHRLRQMERAMAVVDLTGVHMNALTRRATEFPDFIYQELEQLSVIPECEFEQPAIN